jgi:hypothetical protein
MNHGPGSRAARSQALAGTHDLTAARELVLPGARPYLARLPILADSGYEGAGAGVHVPVRKPARGELDIDAKTRNALLRSLRCQGERGFALMSWRWRDLQHVMVSPATIGDLAKAVLVLVQFEHKMIWQAANDPAVSQGGGQLSSALASPRDQAARNSGAGRYGS